MGKKKKGTEIETPVESRQPHKPTISTHREKVNFDSKCGWVEIETHGFSRPSHTAIDFRGYGLLTEYCRNGYIGQTLHALCTKLPKSSEGALGGLTCAFNFRACEMISMVSSFACTEIMAPKESLRDKCVGGTSTCVMISEVLFGYFLFKEKVTDASALKQAASPPPEPTFLLTEG